MNRPPRLDLHDERGLVGRSIVALMLIIAVVGLAAVEAGSIIFTQLSLQNTADQVAADAARAFHSSHDFRAAEATARQTLADHDEDPVTTLKSLTVDPRTGEVIVKLRKQAKTLVVSHISALKHFAVVTATSTKGPPG